MTSLKLKARIQRLERQMRPEGRGTATDERLRHRLQAALKRVAQNRENKAGLKEEGEAA